MHGAAPSGGAGATSYDNPLGQGNRTTLITVTTSSTWLDGYKLGGAMSAWVNGNTSTFQTWFQDGYKEITVKFDLLTAHVIDEYTLYSDESYGSWGASWQWAGSNDDAAWTPIGPAFNPHGTTAGEIRTELDGNTTAYRYYRMLSNSSFIHVNRCREFEFKVSA